MSDAVLTQQQLQELAGRHQQYQYQAEAIGQQINMLKLTIKDLETALTTITALKDEPAGKETLVPIGFGSFVNATLTVTDKVVIGVGAGVSVEKKIEDAKIFLEKRKEELTKYFEQLNNAFGKLAEEMQNIERTVQMQQQSRTPMSAE
ncbi:MAG: prefoldin subunit alpha [Candidatus Methanoperedenaceae archaeon]|nr:prefoldin subunit alpha [Candidatus Methanoperedenaceae archaeon]